MPPSVVEMRAAALLMSGQEGGDLDLVARVVAGPDAGGEGSDDGRVAMLAVVEVDGLGVLEAASSAAAAGEAPVLEIFVYAVGPSLDVRDAVVLRLDAPGAFEAQLLDAGVRALAPLYLDPGPQELRVLARAGERFGLRRLEVDASPGASSGGLDALDLDASGRWLVVWSRQRPADDPALGLSFDPASAQPRALNPLATADGAAVAGADPLEPWPSVLRRRGTDVYAGRRPGGAGATGSVRLPEELGRRLETLLDGYYEAVSLRAAGDAAGAAGLLASLEAGAVDELGDGGLQLLLDQEVRGYERLRRKLRDVRPLLGLIRLHVDAADEHRKAGRYRLASFAVAAAVRLSEWYADEADDAEDGAQLRGEAAAVLVSLAAALQIRGPLADAVSLYRQALEIAPHDEVALFGLATVLSKVGEAEEAAELYGRLVDARPEHHEARLRRAVMLQRLDGADARDRAMRDYQRLVETPAAGSEAVGDWIASLAHQQLIRLDLDAGRVRQAAQRLDTALGRWPDDAPLHFAALRLAELQGDAAALAQRVDRLDPATAEQSAEQGAERGVLSPGGRTRFHEAPHPELQDLRRSLARLEELRRDELARAVSQLHDPHSDRSRRAGSR